MPISCSHCGARNPAANRFCGQCGSRLQLSATAETPEEFGRDSTAHEGEPLEAAADLPPEIIEFDNQIPLFAGENTERHAPLPADLMSEMHDHLEREAEMHDQLHHSSETHQEARAREDAALNAAAFGGKQPLRTGVSGPSFLGLSEDHPSDYLLVEDEEPRSHVRRNLALAVFAAAVVLAAMQWRSMRDYGLAYVQNGSMQVKPRSKDDPKNPPTVAADNTGRDLGLPPAAAKPGAPKALESSPNADRTLKEDASSQPPPAPVAQPAPSAQPLAMSAPPPDLPRENPAPASPPAVHPRSLAKPSAASPPGAEEMSRAARASDAEARAAWLWRAVGKGNPQAPVELARMYEQGSGVVRSCDQAQILLRSAAAKGNEQAKLNLQQMRLRGGCAGR